MLTFEELKKKPNAVLMNPKGIHPKTSLNIPSSLFNTLDNVNNRMFGQKRFFESNVPEERRMAASQTIGGLTGLGQALAKPFTESITPTLSQAIEKIPEERTVESGLFGEIPVKKTLTSVVPLLGLGLDIAAPGPQEIKKAPKVFKGLKDLSTKLLEKFKGMPEEITPQQFNEVVNKAQKEGIRKADLDLVNISLVKNKTGNIDLPKTAAKVEEGLVPLTPTPVKSPRYSSVGEDFIGDGKYGEIVYQSPIKTSAGDVHFPTNYLSQQAGQFSGKEVGFPRYFSHIRYEDMADGKTRKILETQSDLFQKEIFAGEMFRTGDRTDFQKVMPKEVWNKYRKLFEEAPQTGNYTELQKLESQYEKKLLNIRQKELTPLQPYSSNDPLAHLRTFREEVKRAAKDGKDTILIPTGETSMKIENLWKDVTWVDFDHPSSPMGVDDFKIGKIVGESQNNLGLSSEEIADNYIITSVTGNGRFKIVPARSLEFENHEPMYRYAQKKGYINQETGEWNMEKVLKDKEALKIMDESNLAETKSVTHDEDTKHFVYKLNEEAIPKEARKQGLIVEGKIKQDNGEWWKIKIPKERAKMPIEAFGHISTKTAIITGILSSAGTVLGPMALQKLSDYLKSLSEEDIKKQFNTPEEEIEFNKNAVSTTDAFTKKYNEDYKKFLDNINR